MQFSSCFFCLAFTELLESVSLSSLSNLGKCRLLFLQIFVFCFAFLLSLKLIFHWLRRQHISKMFWGEKSIGSFIKGKKKDLRPGTQPRVFLGGRSNGRGPRGGASHGPTACADHPALWLPTSRVAPQCPVPPRPIVTLQQIMCWGLSSSSPESGVWWLW